jgi:L-asparaginase
MLAKINKKIVVLGTGGTIAGISGQPGDNIGYTAAQVGVAQFLQDIPGLSDLMKGCATGLDSEQVAQLDSKDMGFAVWQKLAARICHHLTQADVQGIVITHGTDTLEETAFFLHCVLPASLLASKMVVLTCAMRPSTALAPDGPQNLLDAIAVVLAGGQSGTASGVLAVCAGTVHNAVDVQKVHTYRLDAFGSGDAGPLGYVEEGKVRWVRNDPEVHVKYKYIAIEKVANISRLPRVELVTSHAESSGDLVEALLAQSDKYPVWPLRGLVVAGTGNGTIHRDLEAALVRAQHQGVRVVCATRCPMGRVLPTAQSPFQDSRGLSPVKARLALMLELLEGP